MACRDGQPLFQELLREYDTIHFIKEDGTFDTTTNVIRITNTCLKYGINLNNKLQTINGFTLFPKDYFCPKDCETGILNITNNTYTIHHFDGSWLSSEDKQCLKYTYKYKQFMPFKIAGYAAKFRVNVKYHGIAKTMYQTIKWLKKHSGFVN